VPREAPPELVARVSESFEWWNDGEPELMVDEYAEDCELDFSAVFTDMPVVRGHEGLRQLVNEFWKTFEGLRLDSLDVMDVGEGRFVVNIRLWGRGKRSGAEVDQRSAMLYTTRASDGKIVCAQLFLSTQVALDSAKAAYNI
jgi:ketosteroid isomerase-like protein